MGFVTKSSTDASGLTNEQQRYFQPGTALNRLMSHAPYLARCSHEKMANLIKPREYAIRYAYMQVNRPDMTNWLIFDLDHKKCLLWEDRNLPAPNISVVNPSNGHSHLYYAISPVCRSEKARSKPIRYMKSIYQNLAYYLQADSEYSGPVAKTPAHPTWKTWELHAYEYSLEELEVSDIRGAVPTYQNTDQALEISHSRHCTLFNWVRTYAYSIVKEMRIQGNYELFYRRVEAYAFNKNHFKSIGFSDDLTICQVRSTAKSIAKWSWNHYYGTNDCHRGVMNLDPSESLKERHQQSADRTNQIRIRSTESSIQKACRELMQCKRKLSLVNIAKEAKLSRQTVARYKTLIDHIKRQPNNVMEFPASEAKNVNYGVHQIVAPTSGALVSKKE